MMSEELTKSPPGYRFWPADEELITDYLKPKILGHKLVCSSIVKNIELYGPNSTPWQVLDPTDDHHSWIVNPDKPKEKTIYVFTTLFKLRNSNTTREEGKRENTSKKAGCGTWGGKTKRTDIRDCDGNVIGEKRLLVFEINDIGVQFDLSKAGYFKMHEYCLSGINQGFDYADSIALCKITYDSSKKPVTVIKLSPKINDHVSTTSGEPIQNKKKKNLQATHSSTSKKAQPLQNKKNLQATHSSTSKSATSGVDDNLEGSGSLISENLVVIDSCAVGDHLFDNYDWPVEYNNGFQEINKFGEYPSFDTDWLIGLLTSDQEEGPVEDSSTISKLGKRKFEAEENSYQAKKMCLTLR